MPVNIEQTLSFITQEGVTVLLKKTDNDNITQLTLQNINSNEERFHVYLHKDEVRALLSMIEKVYNPYKSHY